MKPIILATNTNEALHYVQQRGWRNHVAITPTSTWAARGLTGPVYATPQARTHPNYEQMLQDTKPCGQTIDNERVA